MKKTGACTMKNNGSIMYVFLSKLVCLPKLACLSKPLKLTDNIKALAYHKLCPFIVNYESIMFYSTGPSSSSMVVELSTRGLKFECSNPAPASTRGLYYKTFYGRNLRIFAIS